MRSIITKKFLTCNKKWKSKDSRLKFIAVLDCIAEAGCTVAVDCIVVDCIADFARIVDYSPADCKPADFGRIADCNLSAERCKIANNFAEPIAGSC